MTREPGQWGRALAALLVLVVLVLGGQQLYKFWTKPNRPEYCKPAAPTQVTGGRPVAVVLGDSYSQGVLLDDPDREGWAAQLGRQQQWSTFVDAVAGTGVTTPGPCPGRAFGDRLSEALSPRPSILVVQTGINDSHAPAGAVRAATQQLLARASSVRRQVVVGPPPAPGRARVDEMRVDAELRDACRPPRCTYVSAIRWKLQYYPDGVHPTADGHAAFARLVATALRQQQVG